jgi:hypothetical protein
MTRGGGPVGELMRSKWRPAAAMQGSRRARLPPREYRQTSRTVIGPGGSVSTVAPLTSGVVAWLTVPPKTA